MLRAILLVGIGTACTSAAILAFTPSRPAMTAEAAATRAQRQPPFHGAHDTLAQLRPAAEPDNQPAAGRPAPALPLPAVSAAPPIAVRNVTPAGMTAGPVVTGPLVRVARPPPPAAPEPALPARSERLFHPMVVAAGVLKVREREIRLAGIEAPHFQERCGDGPASWPCGRMARAALRRFIRGRAIECAVPAGAEAIPDPASCSVAGTDLAEWLVAQGWAKRADPRFAALEDGARQAKLGLWADLRPDAERSQPAELAVRTGPSAPDSAAPMSARLSGTP